MNIDTVQKINKLAVDLLKQGLAKDREDAVRQAEQVFQQHVDYSSVRETMTKIEEDRQPSPRPTAPALSTDEIKSILEQNSQFLVQKIRAFEEQLKALEQQISILKTQQHSHQFSSPGVSASGSSASHAEKDTEGGDKKDQGHPRTGSYKDQDVSIEKFFYTGKK